jgi:hypothetical protein
VSPCFPVVTRGCVLYLRRFCSLARWFLISTQWSAGVSYCGASKMFFFPAVFSELSVSSLLRAKRDRMKEKQGKWRLCLFVTEVYVFGRISRVVVSRGQGRNSICMGSLQTATRCILLPNELPCIVWVSVSRNSTFPRSLLVKKRHFTKWWPFFSLRSLLTLRVLWNVGEFCRLECFASCPEY